MSNAYTDIMVDLETVGTVPGSGIISIGAVAFAAGMPEAEWSPYYSGPISRRSCRHVGLTEDQATLDWWARQAQDAKAVFDAASNEQTVAHHITTKLSELATWIRTLDADLQVWGNGSDFDNVLLQCAMKKAYVECPWPFYKNRCFRTMKTQFTVMEPAFQGTKHNALEDALHQTRWLQSIWAYVDKMDQRASMLVGPLSDATGCVEADRG